MNRQWTLVVVTVAVLLPTSSNFGSDPDDGAVATRYGMDNHERSGNPDQVACWARCAVDKNYSAWFVGGGTPWIYPRKGRARTNEEGTWGMDHDGLFRPRRVWMNWGCEREQGGLGAYQTDSAPAILEKISLH